MVASRGLVRLMCIIVVCSCALSTAAASTPSAQRRQAFAQLTNFSLWAPMLGVNKQDQTAQTASARRLLPDFQCFPGSFCTHRSKFADFECVLVLALSLCALPVWRPLHHSLLRACLCCVVRFCHDLDWEACPRAIFKEDAEAGALEVCVWAVRVPSTRVPHRWCVLCCPTLQIRPASTFP